MTNEKKDILICMAMSVLGNMPCGGIGPDGPTIKEMEAHVDRTGQGWNQNVESLESQWVCTDDLSYEQDTLWR